MDKERIEDYIDKLKQLDTSISDDDNFDTSFVNELNALLSNLNVDAQQNMPSTFSYESYKMPSLKVRIKKLKENAIIPKYSKDGDAGMDLTITEVISETLNDITYGFGIAMEIPKNYVGLIFPRSSIRKYDLSLSNAVGVIDSGYRGEIQATFKKTEGSYNYYGVGERGAQIMIIPYPQIKFVETEQLSDTQRGEGGFGSSGK
jgi:dUTP pyrophosphatase